MDSCSADAAKSRSPDNKPVRRVTRAHEMLRHGLVMYDALYAWCARLQGETHSWRPAGYGRAV